MKRVSGNVSIEKVTQPKPSAVTITPASSSSSHDDNNEDEDYYDEDEEEEFEPSPAVVRTPNLSQVQITPRNVSRPTLNITPVASPSGGNRSLPQGSSNTESNTQKIPDRPFKIFSKENKSDDDIIIESTSIKSTPLPNFVKPNPPIRNSASPIRAPRPNRPALVGTHTPRARAPSLSPMRMHGPRVPQPMRGALPHGRGRLSNPPPLPNPRQMNNRGRPRSTFPPYQRAQTPPGTRMQFSPRVSQSPQRLPRTPIGFNSTRGAPRLPMARQTRLRHPSMGPNIIPPPITRKLSSQIQITPRNAVAKPSQNPQVSSQAAVNIKPEPQDYEEDYEADNYEDEFPFNMPPPRTAPPQQKLPQVNIAPTGVQTARSAPPVMPRISSAVQITPKVSSQVQITPRSIPHVTQVKAPAVINRQVEEDQVNVKEEPMETEPTAESYDEYGEEQGEEYYNEEEEEREEEEYDEYDPQQQGVPSGSHPVQTSIPTGRKSSVASSNEVLPATPVSLANIKQGPIIKEEPKDEDQDSEMTDDYYNEDNYEEESYKSSNASQLKETKVVSQSSNAPPRVSSSVQITPKLGSQVQLTPQKKAGHPNTLPVVSSSLQITPAKHLPMSESDKQFDESYEEGAEEEDEYYDEEMEDEQMPNYVPPPVSKAGQPPPSAPQTQITPNKFQNVSITPNSSAPVLPKKMSGVSITPNKSQTSLLPPAKPQSVSFTPNVPKGILITPNKLQNISISPSKTQASLTPPNLPKGISITPKKQQFVSTTSSAVSITPNKLPGISMASRGNPQVLNMQSNNIQAGSEKYYEEDLEEEEELGEEEESFEDYDEDDLHEDPLHPRLDARSNTNLTSAATSSSVHLLQKPTQPKVEPRVQHLAKPSPAPGNTSAPPSPQETRTQTRSTPTKASITDAKKPVTQGRSPTMSSYQSPMSQDPAPHGRPRSLIEAISMISSGKMCVSNLSAPTTSKKMQKKEEKIIDNKSDSPGKVSEKLRVQDTNSNGTENPISGTGNEIGSDNGSKIMTETIENNPTSPVKEETVQSTGDIQETLEANEINSESPAISKAQNKNIEETSKSPRTKMRPKSKLLQFRKQMKNPVLQENTPEPDEAKTNAISSLPVQSKPVISEVNINEDRSFDTQNEVSNLKNLESLESDSTELGTVDKTDNSDKERSEQKQSTCQSKVVDNSEPTNNTINSHNPNTENHDDEMLEQAPTDHEDNNKNDIDYYNDNCTSLEQETNSDTVSNDIEEANETVDNKPANIEQKDTIEMMDQSNENIAENIPPCEAHENVEPEAEENMDTEGDIEIKNEFDEDMAQEIMCEQGDEYPAEDFNNTEEEPAQGEPELQEGEEPQNEDNEEDEEEEDGEDEQSDEEKTDEREDAEAGEENDGDTKIKKKVKKKGKKSKKPKKRTAKRKSTDSKLDETPAAKKSKTDDDEAKESGADKEEGGDKSGSSKAINLRKNIRDVIDENQLDPATLAAQKEEAERLKRVQEQQQRLKEVQRQIAQNNKAAKMMNLLEGENSGSSKPSPMVFNLSSGSLNKKMLELLKSQKKEEEGEAGEGSSSEAAVSKLPNLEGSSLSRPLNITSSVSLVPVKKPAEPAQKSKDSSTGGTEVTLSDSDEDCILISEPSDDEGSGEEDRDDPSNSGMHTNDEFNVPDEQGRVLVNLAHEPSEPDIFLAPQIARIIKPHQIGGIRFLFDNIIETTERYKNSPGFGCILAHSMGLGKTLQIVSFSDIFLRHTEGRTVVCIMPINTLQNWVSEFNMWLPLPADMEKSPLLASGEVRPRAFPIFILNDFQKNLPARAKVIKDWYTQGGVLMIGYELYRQLSLKKPKKTRRRGKEPAPPEEEPDDRKQQLLEEIYEALVSPGPDLVICDEGHRIKNSHASTSHALKQIKTRRRVVLTGYPLQNNLLEYWCMVDFVRPNYLGTKTEFSNMFERPIQNGQCVDSTPQDVRLMRHRAHVLHSLLQGFVQRRSHMVLQKTLPVKEEYVLLIRMTPLQRQLYETFMNEVVRTKAVPNPLKAFAVCCKIWNHPDVLYNFLKKRQGGSEDVVADLDIEENAAIVAGCEPGTPKRGSRSKAAGVRNAAGANKNARKGGSPKGPDGTKSPAVATVMPNINPSSAHLPTSAPGPYGYSSYPSGSGENYSSGSFNPATSEGGTFPSSAYYNNPPDSGGNYWGQTPPYSNTSGYHTDTSSNFTDITESSMASMGSMNPPTAFGQNMNSYNTSYGGSNEFSMQPGSSGAYSGYMGGASGGNTFVADGTSSFTNTSGFNSTNNDSFNVNNSLYSSSSPFESNPSNQNTHSFNSNQFAESFNEGSSMYSSANASSSSFNSNQMPVSSANTNFSSNQIPMSSANTFNASNASSNQMPSSGTDLDSAGGLVDMMLSEFPTPNPFDESRSSGGGSGEAPSNGQAGEAPSGEGTGRSSDTPAGGEGGSKGEVTEEKEKGESGGEGEKSSTPVKTSGREEPGIPYDWAEKLMKDYVPGRVEEGNKMAVFMCILEQSLAAGDRILVFSQSLTTLSLIEQFLMRRVVPGRQERWARNKNYFRLDGSTISTDREKLINEFNSNNQVAMFLVSTRAGSLGINLVGANRVIVFDASWNPCHDTQAVCRVYRYGQQKPCFVYRLVMDSCLEKKIYDRQINKQGMADRVVDECNPDAHLSIKEVTNLCWDNEPVPEEKDFSSIKDKYRDSIIQLILDLHSFKLSKEPFQHESLLVDRKDKKLSSAEKRLAKRSYEMEKQAQTKPVYGGFKNNLGKPMASVRPMQSLGGLNMLREGIGAPRNRQWIPAEVWQKQGMSAQEMKLPLDVIIPTNSNERSIVLKKDQKVMVLKSPKGIYMQLENGKIIAIRTANNKGGAGGLGGLGGLGGMTASPRPSMRMNSTRVIDSRLARDVTMTSGTRLHSPRGARPMMSRGPRPVHRGAPLPQPPRFKNVSITPSRPNLVKRNLPTHSVSCGTTTSPPPSPVSSPSEPPKSLPSPSSQSSPAPEPPSTDLSQPSPDAPDSAAQDLSESGSLRGDSSSQDCQRAGSLKGDGQMSISRDGQMSSSSREGQMSSSLRDAQMSSSSRDGQMSSLLRDAQMSSSSRDGQMSSSLRDGQMSSSLRDGQMSSSLRDGQMSSSSRDGQMSSSSREGQMSSSLMGESQISSSLIESQMSISLRGESQITSTVRGGNLMSSSLQDQSMGRSTSSLLAKSQSMGSLRGEGQTSSSLRGTSQTSSSLLGDSQITSSLLGKSQSLNSSLRGESQSLGHSSHLMGSSSMLGKSQMSGSLLSDGQSMGSSMLGDATSLMGGTLKNEPYSRSMHNLIKNESLRPSDDLSLMNFDPVPNASLDYGYDYPAYGSAGGASDFYSTPSYQHAPASAPIYTNPAPESSSSYPYDMYSPFPSAAPGNATFTPVSYGAQSSAFHRPDSYQQHPPAYPSQYPSEFYPPPP